MSPEALELLARDLVAEHGLSPEDLHALLPQARFLRGALKALDELPLDGVDPAAIYQVQP